MQNLCALRAESIAGPADRLGPVRGSTTGGPLPRGFAAASQYDNAADAVHCGDGNDTVYAGPTDVVAPDCETVIAVGG